MDDKYSYKFNYEYYNEKIIIFKRIYKTRNKPVLCYILLSSKRRRLNKSIIIVITC
jgi:hypothetical protein